MSVSKVHRQPLSVLIAVCLLLSGCVEMLPRDEGPPPELADAEQLYRQGDLDHAAQAFLDLAGSRGGDRDHYRLRAAEVFRDAGNLDASAQALAGVKQRRLNPEEATRFALLDAEIALSHHDPHVLERLPPPDEHLTLPLRQRTYELRARAQADAGDSLGSARTRAALNRSLGGADRTQNETLLVATLQKLGPDALKQQAATLPPSDPLGPWLNQALRGSGQALPQIVLRPNQAVGTLMPGGQDNVVAREGYRPAHRIALLLPSGGALRTVANAVRDGFLAAYFNDPDPQRAEVRSYDSGDTPQQAVDAYRQAVSDGAERIVGPLRRDAVSAVFAQGRLPVPVLTLNQPEHGEVAPPGSAAFGLSPDTEAAQAAEHMLERGIRNAVIITATDDWAERSALAFRAQLENHNGSVLGDARLKDGDINYAATIRQAMNAVPTTGMAPQLPGAVASADASAAPTTAVFISMRPQQARLLLPQLRLAGYTGVPVFATSHIYAGNPDPGQDRDLDGVEFCDAPWLFDIVPGLPHYSDISRVLDSARGAAARLFAMGLDAYSLLPYLEWLSQHHDAYLPGATGQLSEDELDRIQRLLVWARFNGGIARPIVGGLQVAPAAP